MDTVVSVRTALLQVLELPGCGVDLARRIRRLTKGLLRPGSGSIYPALSRLEAQGLVRARTVHRARAGRPTRAYELTLKGVAARAALHDALRGLVEPAPAAAVRDGIDGIRSRLERCAAVSAAAAAIARRARVRRP